MSDTLASTGAHARPSSLVLSHDQLPTCGPHTTTADFDNNGTVNILDLLTVVANWD